MKSMWKWDGRLGPAALIAAVVAVLQFFQFYTDSKAQVSKDVSALSERIARVETSMSNVNDSLRDLKGQVRRDRVSN